MAGDAECCEAIVGMLNGQQWKAPFTRELGEVRVREYRSLVLDDFNHMARVEAGVWLGEAMGTPIEITASQVELGGEFFVTLDGDFVEGHDLILTLDNPEMLTEIPLQTDRIIMFKANPVTVPGLPVPNKP